METEIAFTCTQTQTSTPSHSPSPDPVYPEPGNASPSHHAPRSGTVIPNRIFVGGIDFKTNENDLRRFFSQHGAVREVKIVIDRAGVSKGYGFVTFDTEEDVQKILHDADRLSFRDKRLNIGQAIRKQQIGVHPNSFSVSSPTPAIALPAPCGTMYLTTSTGYPYTFHNGVAYFHSTAMRPPAPAPAHHWPPQSVPGSPVMVTHPPQPIYQQPAYHHYQAPAQCIPGHLQWNHPQSPAPSSPVLYMQPSELLYQSLEMPPDGGCLQPALPVLETAIPEPQFIDHMVQPTYHQVYAQSPGGMAPVLQQEPVKDQKFHAVRRSFPHSPVSLKPRYHLSPHYPHLRNEYLAEISDSSPASATDPLK